MDQPQLQQRIQVDAQQVMKDTLWEYTMNMAGMRQQINLLVQSNGELQRQLKLEIAKNTPAKAPAHFQEDPLTHAEDENTFARPAGAPIRVLEPQADSARA